MQITEHLSLEEVACHDGTEYPVDQVDDEDPEGRKWGITRLLPLAETFEAIRAGAGGEPITVDSGYRTLAYDQRLYDADKGRGLVAQPNSSQHPKGRALDLVHSTLSAPAFFTLILQLYHLGALPHLGGVGLYPTFVHVDVAPRAGSKGGEADGHLRIWGGDRPSNIA